MASQTSVNFRVLRKAVKQHLLAGEYKEAKEIVKDLEMQMTMLASEIESDEKTLLFTTLAKYYRQVQQYDKAANYSQQALNISKKIEKTHTSVVIDAYLNDAGLNWEYGQLADARILLAKLLMMLEKNNWQDPFAYGLVYRNLGNVYVEEGNIELGLKQLEQALGYFRKAVSGTHPIIAQTIDMISDVYVRMENYQSALQLHRQLLETYQTEKDNFFAGKLLLKMAAIYFYIDLKQARETIMEALTLLEEIDEDKQLDIAKAYLMLAEIDENVGNIPGSIHYYQQSLDQLDSLYDENHFMIAYTYAKIGTLSFKENALEQVKQYLEKGLILASDIPKLKLQFLYALGKVYSEKKMYEASISALQEFLQLLKQSERKKLKGYADTLQAIALNLLKQDKVEDAIGHYEAAIAIYEQLAFSYSEEKNLIHVRLSYCREMIESKDSDEAARLYEKGFQRFGQEIK